MSQIVNCSRVLLNQCKGLRAQCVRQLSLSPVSRIKEIHEKKEGDTLVISGIIKPQNDPLLMKAHNKACPLCAYGLEVKHTDVLIINQFVDSQGKLLGRHISGLCAVQHKRMDYLLEMAKAAGLMSNAYPKEKVTKDKKWKNYNTYYDESTIKYRYF